MRSQEAEALFCAATKSVQLSQGLIKRIVGSGDGVRYRLLKAQEALVRAAFHLQMAEEMTAEMAGE